MQTQISPIEYFRSVVAEKRFTQGTWYKKVDGKEYVCLAAAWGKPGTIHSPSQCPTNLFPQWVFELMPTIDDGVKNEDVPWLFKGFAARADRMASFDSSDWERVRTAFLIGAIDIAVDAARPKTAVPAYWKKVEDACKQVVLALKGQGDLKAAANAAMAAANAAANAANANAANAAAEAANAANAAAFAAANAAAFAANAANAANAAAFAAAKQDTYRQLASVFFACVDGQAV